MCPQAKTTTHNILMIPATFHSHSRPSSPSSAMIDQSGMKRQASLPPEYPTSPNLMIQINPVEQSPDGSSQIERSGTWPLNSDQQLSAPRTTRDRSISQPQQDNHLNVRTQQKLKRRSMTNMRTSLSSMQTPYTASPEPESPYPYTSTGYDYPYALPLR